MENILNDGIIKCYLITKEVVNKYMDFLPIVINNAIEEVSVYETYVDEIKELVLNEYEAYRSLSVTDIDMCLDFLSKENFDSSMIGYRFKRKLKILKDIYEGHKINVVQLGLDFGDNNIEFNIFTSLTALVDIRVMKLVKEKLNTLCVDNSNDFSFTELLHREFSSVFFSQIFDNDLTEFIGLFYNMDIENIPDVDIDVLCNQINNKFSLKDNTDFKPVDVTLVEISKITVDRLVEISFENDPEIIFKYLLFITRLEVLISYMDKNGLFKLLEYCELFVYKNNFGINNVMKLINDRIK